MEKMEKILSQIGQIDLILIQSKPDQSKIDLKIALTYPKNFSIHTH